MTLMYNFVCEKPPSINRKTRFGKGGVYTSKESRQWESDFCDEMVFAPHFPGEFKVQIVCQRKRKGMDIDNVVKPLLDGMQKANLIANDKDNVDLRIRWAIGADGQIMRGNLCYVFIEEIIPVEKPLFNDAPIFANYG